MEVVEVIPPVHQRMEDIMGVTPQGSGRSAGKKKVVVVVATTIRSRTQLSPRQTRSMSSCCRSWSSAGWMRMIAVRLLGNGAHALARMFDSFLKAFGSSPLHVLCDVEPSCRACGWMYRILHCRRVRRMLRILVNMSTPRSHATTCLLPRARSRSCGLALNWCCMKTFL